MEKAKRMALLSGRVKPLKPSQIATAYWLTDASVKAIAAHYRCSVRQVCGLAGAAQLSMPPCPVCGQPFTAAGRDEAIKLVTLPVYPEHAEQGLVPVCCGRWVSWYWPLEHGDHASGEYGGGAIGTRWRRMNEA